MHGMLKIHVGVQTERTSRLISIYTEQCKREEANDLVVRFKRLNPSLTGGIAAITWQADREWL